MESGICDICGEPTKVDLLRNRKGQRICIPCAERRQISACKHSVKKKAGKMHKKQKNLNAI